MSHSSSAAPPRFRIVAVERFAPVVKSKAVPVELKFSMSLEHATFPLNGSKKPYEASAEWKPSHAIASWAHWSKNEKTGEIRTTSAKPFNCKEAGGITAASDLRAEWGGATAAVAEINRKKYHPSADGEAPAPRTPTHAIDEKSRPIVLGTPFLVNLSELISMEPKAHSVTLEGSTLSFITTCHRDAAGVNRADMVAAAAADDDDDDTADATAAAAAAGGSFAAIACTHLATSPERDEHVAAAHKIVKPSKFPRTCRFNVVMVPPSQFLDCVGMHLHICSSPPLLCIATEFEICAADAPRCFGKVVSCSSAPAAHAVGADASVHTLDVEVLSHMVYLPCSPKRLEDGTLTEVMHVFVEKSEQLTAEIESRKAAAATQRSSEHEEIINLRQSIEEPRNGQNFTWSWCSFPACLKQDIQDQLIPSNQVGSGGQGVVYRVKYSGQTLACKIFHTVAEGAGKWWEIYSLARLKHTNIVRILYVVHDTIEDHKFSRAPLGFVMELMERPIADYIWHSRLPFSQLLSVFEQIASALTYAHQHGHVHFDVQPANILLDSTCAVAKLCDFACSYAAADAADAVLMRQKFAFESKLQSFTAPEVNKADLHGSVNSKLCDVYSFGKTMWQLLDPSLDVIRYPVEFVRFPFDVLPRTSFPCDLFRLAKLVEQCVHTEPSSRPQDMSCVLSKIREISICYHGCNRNYDECESILARMPRPSFNAWFDLQAVYSHECDSINVDKIKKRVTDLCLQTDVASWTTDDCDAIMYHVVVLKDHFFRPSYGFPPVPEELYQRPQGFPLNQNPSRVIVKKVMEYFRAVMSFGSTCINRIRVMMVGLGEVGKTRLVQALQNEDQDFTAPAIDKKDRTIAADISEFLLIPSHAQSQRLTACIWDFAGQEVYYMAHSMFMSSRAVYVLVWKRPDEAHLDLEAAQAGLRRWLEMIVCRSELNGSHASKSKFVIVGTHCATPPCDQDIDSYKAQFAKHFNEIKSYVQKVVRELNHLIIMQDRKIERKLLLGGQSKVLLQGWLHRRALYRGISNEFVTPEDIAAKDVLQMSIEDQSFFAVDSATGEGVRALNVFLDEVGRSPSVNVVVPKSWSLIEKCMADYQRSSLFASIVSKTDAVQRFVQFFQKKVVDSLDDSVVDDLLTTSITVSQSHDAAMQFWSHLGEVFVHDSTVIKNDPKVLEDKLQTFVTMHPNESSRKDSEVKFADEAPASEASALFSNPQEFDGQIANRMSSDDIWNGFLFWHDIGSMFIHTGADSESSFVVPNPKVLLDFLKPLMHMSPIDMLKKDTQQDFKDNFLAPYSKSGPFTLKEPGAKINNEKYIRKVLNMLSQHCIIQSCDLIIFQTWKNIEDNRIRQDLLNCFRAEEILEFEDSEDPVLTVNARIHVTPGSYMPFNLQFYLVYLLPFDSVSLLVKLRNAFSWCMKGSLAIKRSFFRSGMTLVFEMKRNDKNWCQIVIQPASGMIIDDCYNFTALAEDDTSFSCVMSLNCQDRACLLLATSCISDVLNLSYPFFDIPYWISTKHIDAKFITSSQVPWVNLSDILHDHSASLPDLISNAFGSIKIEDDTAVEIELPCAAIFPAVPLITIIAFPDGHQEYIHFLQSFRNRLENEFVVTVEIILVHESQKTLDASKISTITIAFLTPNFLCSPICMSFLHRVTHGTVIRNCLHVISLHPSVTHRGIGSIIDSKCLLMSSRGDGLYNTMRLCANSILILKILQELHMDAAGDGVPVIWDEWSLSFEIENPEVNCILDAMWPKLSTHMKDAIWLLHSGTNLLQSVSKPKALTFQWDIELSCEIPLEYNDIVQCYQKRFSDEQSHAIVQRLISYSFSSMDIRKCLRAHIVDLPLESVNSFNFAHSCFNVDVSVVRSDYSATRSSSVRVSPMNACVGYQASGTPTVSSCSFSSSSGLSSCSAFSLIFHGDVSWFAEHNQSDDVIEELIHQFCVIFGSKDFSVSPRSVSVFQMSLLSASCVETRVIVDNLGFRTKDNFMQVSERFDVTMQGNRGSLQIISCDTPDAFDGITEAFAKHGVSVCPPFYFREGSHGKVYKCQYINPQTRQLETIAAKVCNFSSIKMDDNMHNEGLLLGFCQDSENIVKSIGHFDIFGNLFSSRPTQRVILMEWLECGDLRRVLFKMSKSPQFMSTEIFSRFYSQILGAVCFLHKEEGTQKPCILHRDIKPENILIKVKNAHSKQRHDHMDLSQIVLKLSDLGLSKSIQPGHKGGSDFRQRGTPFYKSPESFLGNESCTSDDVWSAAIVLVELMCGCSRIHPRNPPILLFKDDDDGFTKRIYGVDREVIEQHCLPCLTPFIEPVLSALKEDKRYRCINSEELGAALQHCKENLDLMKDVFICHHPDDSEYAQLVEGRLSELGLKVHRASSGKLATELCDELLNYAAVFARLYLESKLRELHKYVFDFEGVDELHGMLKEGPSHHSWNSKSMSASFDTSALKEFLSNKSVISIEELHRLISDKAGQKGKILKLANANMQNIADPETGWLELGKMFTSSCGTHGIAIEKTGIGDLDAEATFNILKHLETVDGDVRKSSEQMVLFRHQGSAHIKTKLSGESKMSAVADIITGIRLFAKRIDECHPDSNFDRLYHKIDICEQKIQDCIFENIRILIQSRFVVPVLSQSTIDEWLKIDDIKYDPVLIYTCAGFAARDMAKCSRFMCSRVKNIHPVIPSDVSALQSNISFDKRSRCFPEFFRNAANGSRCRIFAGNSFMRYEDTDSLRTIIKVDDDLIVCPDHSLSPNSCITLTGNLETVTFSIQGAFIKQYLGVFFVIEDGFSTDAFKISAKLGDNSPVSIQTGNATIGFKLASTQLFHSFVAKSLFQIWPIVIDKDSERIFVEGLNESAAHAASSFLKDKVFLPQDACACRFEILDIVPDFVDSSYPLIPTSEIVRLKVKLLPDFDSKTLPCCKFHEIPQINAPEMCLKVAGTCLSAEKLPSGDREFLVQFLIERGYNVQSFTRTSNFCSCKFAPHSDDHLTTFKHILQESCDALRDVHSQIKDARLSQRWDDVASLRKKVHSVIESKYTDVLGREKSSVSDAASLYMKKCTSLYSCVSSVRLKVQKIQEILELCIIPQQNQFEIALKDGIQSFKNCSISDAFQELLILSDFAGLQHMLDKCADSVRCGYHGNFDNDIAKYGRDLNWKGLKKEFEILSVAQSYEPLNGALASIDRRLIFLEKVTSEVIPRYFEFKKILEGPPDFEKLKKCHRYKERILAPLRVQFDLKRADLVKHVLSDYSDILWVAPNLKRIPDWIDNVALLILQCNENDAEYQGILGEIEALESVIQIDSSLCDDAKKRLKNRNMKIKSENDLLRQHWRSAIISFKDWVKEWSKKPIKPKSLTFIHLQSSFHDGSSNILDQNALKSAKAVVEVKAAAEGKAVVEVKAAAEATVAAVSIASFYFPLFLVAAATGIVLVAFAFHLGFEHNR